MKLIRCHIENFGILHDFDYVFNAGINVIHAENGWGKSTLASFIRVMFYGFDKETKKSIEERERVQKAPWQGGVYGGSLVFETGGRTYRIVRTFDSKKGSRDTFELYDEITGLPSRDYSRAVGEELFDIDRESYQRTVYIAQNDCMTNTTDQINARIGNISQETADMGNYEQAIASIHHQINSLSDTRATGMCYKLRQQISSLQAKTSRKPDWIRQSALLLSQMESCHEKLQEIQNQQKKCNDQLKQAAEISSTLAEMKVYESMKEELQQKQNRVEETEDWFVDGVPSLQETEQMLGLTRKMESQLARCESLALTSREKLTLDQFDHVFSAGVPGSDLLAIISGNVAEYELIHQKISDSRLSENEMAQLMDGRKRFENSRIDEKILASMPVTWQSMDKQKSALEQMRKENETAVRKRKKMVFSGCAVIVAGILSALCRQWIPSLLAVMSGIGLWIYAGSRKNNLTEMENLQKQTDDLQKQIDAFLKEYGFTENDCPDCFYTLLHDYRQWKELNERYHASLDEDVSRKEKRLYTRLQDFFFPLYGKTDDFRGRLEKLNNDINEYDALMEKKDRFVHERQHLRNNLNTCQSFCRKYGFVPSSDLHAQISTIRDHILSLQQAQYNLHQHQESLEEYEHTHNLYNGMNEASLPDLTLLQQQQMDLQKTKEDLQQQIHSLLRQKQKVDETVEQMEQMEMEAGQYREQYDALQHQLQILIRTGDALKQARNLFTARYMKPIRESFDRWYSILSSDDQKQYELDADLNIRLVAYGRSRHSNAFSQGYKDLIGLCRRMAMIDAMYEKEKPFIILDDPFINLDDEKLVCAQQFVHSIAAHCQVIYLTCHNSRVIAS